MTPANTLDFARAQDLADPLRSMRSRFYMPQHAGGNVIYFTGNSLGLQPKTTRAYLEQELDAWATYGVEGHFMGKSPWLGYHELFHFQFISVIILLHQH